MQISTMRIIDRYVGIPLCFLMDIVWSIGYLFQSHKKREPDLSRTLFIELSEMGSAVLADPTMRYLRDKKGSELFFVIFQSNAESLDILQTVMPENRFLIRSDNFWKLCIDVVRFIVWCRRKKISAVIDLELFSRFTALLTALTGAHSRIGFHAHYDEGFYRGHFINYPVRYNAHVHISVNFLSLVHTAMGYHNSPYPTTPVHNHDLTLAQAHVNFKEEAAVKFVLDGLYSDWQLRKIVLFNINASDLLPQRKWLTGHFLEVAVNLLNQNDNLLILAIGSSHEKEEVEKFVESVGDRRCLSVAGCFRLRELLALFRLSVCLLTNDSGPAQFASAVSLKTFVVFGPETPDLYKPLGNQVETFYLALPCSPCVSAANHRKTDCKERPCIKGILPETVGNKIKEFLQI